ncbi:MAG: glycosyltransferase, partial [Rhizobiaceae bacterium]
VVVSSRAEAMPYIVLEALGAGKPVIATRVGGIPEILGPDSLGLCAISSDALAEKMQVFATDPGKILDAMPRKVELKSRFGVTVMARQIEEQYRLALAA